MAKRLIQHHDAFAKHILDQPDNADAFLRERLPAAVVARLAAKPAVDRSESHVPPELRDLRGDRVYSLETVDGDEVLIWTLIEHKSAPKPDILKQLLTDLTGLALKGARERRLPDGHVCIVPAVVYPIILFHGTEPWPYPDTLADAYGLPPDLTALGPLSFRYILVNLLEIPDDRLSSHPPLRAALLVLKYARTDDDPRVTLERLLETAAHLGLNTIIVVVRYLAKESEVDLEDLRRLVARFMPQQEETVMGPAARQIIELERPNIIAEARPNIIAEARPNIIAEARPKILDEGRVATLLRLLERKFGTLPDGVVHRVRAANSGQLDQWTDAILDAKTIDDILTPAP